MDDGGKLAPEVVYDADLRERLEDGDIVLCTGNGPMSRMIRWLTRSRFSHAAIILHWHGRVLVHEAVGSSGVRVWLLSACVRKYNGRVTLYRPTKETRERLDLAALRRVALDHLGTGYRTMGLFQSAWHLLVSRKKALKDFSKRPPKREFLCSELVSACYREAGIDLAPDVPDGYTTPGDLERSPSLVRVGRLVPAHWADAPPSPPSRPHA